MKKLLSLFGAILLFGLASANAITVNFNFSTSNNAAPGNYITIYQQDEGYQQVTIPSSNTVSFTYDDQLILNIMTIEGVGCDISIVGDGGGSLTPEYLDQLFKTLNVDGNIKKTVDEGITNWDILLPNMSDLNGYNFNVFINTDSTGDSGNTGTEGGDPESKEISAYLNFGSSDDEFEPSHYYTLVSTTAKALTGSISDFDVDDDTYPFSFTPSISLSFTPDEGYMIENILLYGDDDFIMDNELAQITAPTYAEGTWSLTLNDGLPDDLRIYVMILEVPEDFKKVTLNILNGTDLVNAIVLFTEDMQEFAEVTFTGNTAIYNYTDYIGFSIYSGDNSIPMEVTCANADLSEGTDYLLNEDDNVWSISLNENSPQNITFNISFPSLAVIKRTATLNIKDINPALVAATYYTVEEITDYDQIMEVEFEDGTATLTYTDYLVVTVLTEDNDLELEVSCANSALIEGQDYTLTQEDEDDITSWFIYLNDNSPEEITFNISPAVAQSNVTLKFEGINYTDGMIEVTDGTMSVVEIENSTINYSFIDETYLYLEIPASTDTEEYSLTFYCEGVDQGNTTYSVSNLGRNYTLILYPGMNGKTLVITLDKSSGIDSIQLDENAVIYNIQGLRINDANNLPKGLYIINGKKVLVK